jgi:carboxypeptidase C (cathepsin A)
LALLLAVWAAVAGPATVFAQAPPGAHPPQPSAPAASQAPAAEKADPSRLFPPDAVSRHTLALGDKRLAYTATAGTLPLLGAKGEVSARIFSVAYTLDQEAAGRPITFVFNGGPGAASAFLHLGTMGPRAVNFSANGATALQPVALADNPDAWLDFTDLVFVDPVATGYSRSAAGSEEADKAFFGVEKDADALADFVRLTLTRAGRTLSPVFLAGESYGGFRVALLAHRLVSQGTAVKGVVMISPALEFSLLRNNAYALLPLALVLPSIAATHLERRDGAEASLDVLPEVERFARSGYLVHLAAGLRNDAEIDKTLARYTGLAPDVIRDHPDWYNVNAKGESAVDKPAYVDYYKFLDPARPEDSSVNASIPVASVDVTNVGTGVASHAVTGSSGDFTLPYLPPGIYRVTVQVGAQSLSRAYTAQDKTISPAGAWARRE